MPCSLCKHWRKDWIQDKTVSDEYGACLHPLLSGLPEHVLSTPKDFAIAAPGRSMDVNLITGPDFECSQYTNKGEKVL